ncbi:MAG: hypothetical protein ACRCW9_06125 [Cetobacterium sp.]
MATSNKTSHEIIYTDEELLDRLETREIKGIVERGSTVVLFYKSSY